MLDSSRFIDERISTSVTALIPVENPIDADKPLTFIEWLKYNNSLFTNADDFLLRYQSYLNNWYEIKGKSKDIIELEIRRSYTSLINEIVLSYSSSEEKRFLKNIDFNNKRDLAIAVPFFAKKIKDICLYYSTLRDDVKTAQLRYNLKGSNLGIEKLVYNEISKSLEADDLVDIVRTLNLSLSDIRNNLVINLEDIFDTYSYYLDNSINQAPSANGITNGERQDYYSANTYDINPSLFLDFNSSIVQAISSYPFFLIELGTNNLSINLKPESTDLDLLKDSDYINTVNTEVQSNLNLNLQIAAAKKYIGTEFYFLSTNSTNTAFISGILFTPDNEFANYLNKRFPSIAAIPSTEYLKTAKEIGLFFKPDKIGLSVFNNFKNNYSIKSLSANTVYVFPNPEKYGNVSSLTKESFNSPLEFYDNSYLLKLDFSNQFAFGDATNNSYLQTFRSYQSREQSNLMPLQGLARYTDPQDFFKGEFRSIWSNSDIYPLIPQNIFPIDDRVEKLYSLDKTLVQFKSDVYGNDYSFYKEVYPKKSLSNIYVDQDSRGIKYCFAFDGHLFYDPVSGSDFNYDLVDENKGYSGVTFRAVTQIPPGSGYFTRGPNSLTPSPLSAQYYNNGIPKYFYSDQPTPVISYRFQPETYCSDVVNVTYLCNSFDGVGFVSSDGVILPDVPSDTPTYDPFTDILYYVELVDGGSCPTNPPTFIANFVNPPSFSFAPPLSALSYADGFKFLVNGNNPCGGDVQRSAVYTEKSQYLNYRVPYRSTTVVETQPGLINKRSLYETRFIDFGELYVRNSNSSLLAPASAALSALYYKYDELINNELDEKLINFDVFYDVINFETENYLIFDKIKFNYTSNLPITNSNADCFFARGENKKFEKFSTTWFNETENKLYFCRTVLFNELSATSYKIIYPEIYEISLNTMTSSKIYPQDTNINLTVDKLKLFSLIGKSIDLNIVEIEKPLLTYDDETSNFTITYLGKDLSNVFYINKIYFKYINGVITILNAFMHKIDQNVVSINFANVGTSVPSPVFSTYNVRGATAGSVSGGVFSFGV